MHPHFLRALLTLAIVATGCSTAADVDEVADPIDECVTCDAKADNNSFGDRYVVEAVLELANTATLHTLDHEVRLYSNAAANIVEARPFTTIEALDAVPYVGRASFDRLIEYVIAHNLVGSCGDGVEQRADQCGAAAACAQDCAQSKANADTFSGRLRPGDTHTFVLTADAGDSFIIRAKPAGESDWMRRLELLRDGSTLEYSISQGADDSHIPYRDGQLPFGFELWRTGDYAISLSNDGPVEGDYELTVECVTGGCNYAITAEVSELPEVPEVPEVPEGPDEPEVPSTVDDPRFAGLRDDALESALRSANASIWTRDYRTVREFMFGTLDNVNNIVTCVYTGVQHYTVGIPDHTVMNTEHLWPQSQRGPYTDLHHLRPTDSAMNAQRSSFPFGDVVGWDGHGSTLGHDAAGYYVFEPPDDHKGDIARSLFYVAVQYQLDIPDFEEAALRQWHRDDPVSDVERRRNDSIETIQSSRNLFIDFPELVDQIADF